MGFSLNPMTGFGLFEGGGGSVTQEPLITKDQQAAIDALKSYYTTGKLAGSNYNAGEAYGGSLGNYQTTGIENSGISALSQLLNNAQTMAGSNFFNPEASGSVYQTFKKQALKDQADQSAALNRNMAATGSLYSTNQGVQQRKLGENTTDLLQSKLAELADAAVGRQFQAQTGLQNAIGATQQYGGLARTLQNQEAQLKYNAWLNQRTEQQNQIQNMLNAMQNNSKSVDWGVKTASLPDNTMSNVLSAANTILPFVL